MTKPLIVTQAQMDRIMSWRAGMRNCPFDTLGCCNLRDENPNRDICEFVVPEIKDEHDDNDCPCYVITKEGVETRLNQILSEGLIRTRRSR